ncbi:MAG: Mut7-C RNAse domain-containing protein [Nitrosopumilus sp.]|nr:Mut7-C RNAse domain-containing protein [Nitrosopumilus sp.]
MLFLVDGMLGNVAKKLLLLGYDTDYFSGMNDSELIKKAKHENRVIISKDRQLIANAKKSAISTIQITKDDEIEQFLEILNTVHLEVDKISGDTARCTKCNSQTTEISKSEILDKVPSKVLEFNEKFWECDKCKQIYWEGTHVKKLQDFVNKIKIQT